MSIFLPHEDVAADHPPLGCRPPAARWRASGGVPSCGTMTGPSRSGWGRLTG